MKQLADGQSSAPRRQLARSSTRRSLRIMPVLAFNSPAEIDAMSMYKSLSNAISRVSPSFSSSSKRTGGCSSLKLVVALPVVDVPPPHLHIADPETRLMIQADYRSSLEASIWMNLAVSSTPVPSQKSAQRNSAPPSGLQPPRYIKMPDGGNIVVSTTAGSVPPSQIASAMLSYGLVKLASLNPPAASAPIPSRSLAAATAV